MARAEEILCALLLVEIVVVLGLNVILRYVFYTAYAPGDELVGFSFVWFVYLSMVVAARKGRHFRMEFFVARLPAGMARAADRVASVVWLAFNLLVVVQGVALVQAMHRFKNRSPMLGWSMEYVYLIIPVSFGFVSLYIVLDTVRGGRTPRAGRRIEA